MNILHAFWHSVPSSEFIQPGDLWLWVETIPEAQHKQQQKHQHYPYQLAQHLWPAMIEQLQLTSAKQANQSTTSAMTLWLPSADTQPLPSPQLTQYLDDPVANAPPTQRQPWTIHCYQFTQPIKQLHTVQYLAQYRLNEVQLGTDYLFWSWFTRQLKRLLWHDHYLPTLIRQAVKSRSSRTSKSHYYGTWRWAGAAYEQLLQQTSAYMPASAMASYAQTPEPTSLAQHCAEVLLDRLMADITWPDSFLKNINQSSLLTFCIAQKQNPDDDRYTIAKHYPLWQTWRNTIAAPQENTTFTLGFRLLEPSMAAQDTWPLEFLMIPHHNPSQRLRLSDYWTMSTAEQALIKTQIGTYFERDLLRSLGFAARIYPQLWSGLKTATPHTLVLNGQEAAAFLKEHALILEEAGFKIIVPAWWSSNRRKRIKIRINTHQSSNTSANTDSTLGADYLMTYRYELALGDQTMTAAEWEQLIHQQGQLVQFRGQWIELDPDNMHKILAFWQQHGHDTLTDSIPTVLQQVVDDDLFDINHEDRLATILEQLRDPNRLELVTTPSALQATLRPYQIRGLAWLTYLEQLGLNGCLADDMGLGKTIQVIARLVAEHEKTGTIAPTVLIAPTSVLRNWCKEMARFAPHLSTWLHHGPQREKKLASFQDCCNQHTLIITSYALARKDLKLFTGVTWHRVVLDEAQMIKNPQSAQTKAILKIPATHRLVLTGTPIENRLTDLWSLFHFLQPGYLGTHAQFRKRFEIPIQRDHDAVATTLLKRLIEPFILRRVKTDQTIISDLPDKIEGLQYCQLTAEQAALYETVVRTVEQQIDATEGITRQGLILSTLTQLKQICNHPAQFLADGSAFTVARSHKLQRLQELLDEVMAEGDSALIFSQFTEIGSQLARLLRRTWHYNTYYLHGGTPAAKRERMINEFQDPDTEPSVFILSLKAGGVGITLTKANHVFHFDRWWNPAVENQASDRAFRIGQQKNVMIHKFVTVGTLEERIHDIIEAKKSIAEVMISHDESWLNQLDNEQFKALIRLNRDALGE
jgi:SNF2 family DNA or RNA helicase